MDNLLNNGVEKLSGALKVHSNTKTAFKLVAGMVEEIAEFVKGQSKGKIGSLRKLGVPVLSKWHM